MTPVRPAKAHSALPTRPPSVPRPPRRVAVKTGKAAEKPPLASARPAIRERSGAYPAAAIPAQGRKRPQDAPRSCGVLGKRYTTLPESAFTRIACETHREQAMSIHIVLLNRAQ